MSTQSSAKVGSGLTFRTATLSDAAAVRALVVSAFRGDSSREGWTTEADLFTDERISEAGVGAVVQLGMVAVAPKKQGQGIGKLLITHLEEIAIKEYKAETMELYVIWLREDVINFYARRGFIKTERTKPFPYAELVNGKALRLDLYFVVLEKRLL
ncbi:hypothetical protein BBAD15_g11298 [Beauveria bassiana D1-5]|uniref:N-acetyltransferase domain-containing protein n=1 Tax=Beauveria bassiana D1-5 TaxID=1245745 RepID=A0A0A2VRN1_BEABA|nr:hypothetical protein BBAD15_g11298 [Beauveria bassiana D1-5]